MGVSASMPLYEGNKLNLQIERATLALEQNDLYVKEAQNNITLSVLEAYLQALYQYENNRSGQEYSPLFRGTTCSSTTEI